VELYPRDFDLRSAIKTGCLAALRRRLAPRKSLSFNGGLLMSKTRGSNRFSRIRPTAVADAAQNDKAPSDSKTLRITSFKDESVSHHRMSIIPCHRKIRSGYN